LSIFEFEDAPVADGDAEDVWGQVFESGLARTDRLTMNHPLFVPAILIDELKQVGLLELIAEFGAEERRERFDVNEKILPRMKPSTVGRESAAGGDVVDVWMIKQITSPGMQDADHPETGADETRI